YQEEPPSSSEPPSSEPPSSEPPTTEPPATQTTKTDEPGLPVTGASLGGLIATGVALVAGGVGLLLWRRRRDITDAGAAS
ncbi:MAG TPA: LPXTG cell wall anchor domain-containing protein, partial [Micromonosporaceae bacterium]|nr:LPXTG cell wall anchor domain-containing protein [Micromonosporaceae bacterium]